MLIYVYIEKSPHWQVKTFLISFIINFNDSRKVKKRGKKEKIRGKK